MQIVIDIPKELYERFGYEYSEENLISKSTNDVILEAFCNGTPLPEGHGRLIDADVMKTMKSIQSANFNAVGLIRYWIDNQPAIIEADTAESEGEG